ncbi:hypothetical protein NCCP691_39200 [Noviherbaspirillum aridicola]|uniref:Uncharacterized protein n=1 Tax=Noviherbaspirillum aridicola TaxID=2849687 RepID=A0ABQ4QA22_9BURK|nr:hypothetical protein NCCP691_39200 [Noviherbaspirillum aridicola]
MRTPPYQIDCQRGRLAGKSLDDINALRDRIHYLRSARKDLSAKRAYFKPGISADEGMGALDAELSQLVRRMCELYRHNAE